MGYMFADDSIIPKEETRESYTVSTGEEFHKTFVSAGGYFLEFDFRADEHYDANGLGRVHKEGCSPFVCLSVPFAKNPNYKIPGENMRAASICCYKEKDGVILSGADRESRYVLKSSAAENNRAETEILCTLGDGTTVAENYNVSADGVDITLSGGEISGCFIPVFDFDGAENTDITVKSGEITCGYKNSVCVYCFSGSVQGEEYIYNRNGKYRLMRVTGEKLHIEIKNRN